MPAVAFTDARARRHMLGEFKGALCAAQSVGDMVRALREGASGAGQAAGGRAGRDGGGGECGPQRRRAETARSSPRTRPAHLAVYVDSNVALVRAFEAYGLPLSVLIDPEGREVARADGPAEWDAPEAIAYFQIAWPRGRNRPPRSARGCAGSASAAPCRSSHSRKRDRHRDRRSRATRPRRNGRRHSGLGPSLRSACVS